MMRIGSVSKIVTAVGVLKLIEDGRIRFDSRVFGPTGLLSEYGPDSGSGDSRILDITVLDLLQHTSGWDHRLTGGDPVLVTRQLLQPKSRDRSRAGQSTNNINHNNNVNGSVKSNIIRYMLNHTLHYKPGTRYSYSNFGYSVLGLVIERVSGRPYEVYTRGLLRRIGIERMKLAASSQLDNDISEVEYFYRDEPPVSANGAANVISDDIRTGAPLDRGVSETMMLNVDAVDSSCGWIASASDVVRLVESLASSLTGSASDAVDGGERLLLKPETVRRMLSRPSYASSSSGSEAADDGASTVWYGLGVVVEDGGRTFWHSGTLDGSTSVAAHDGPTGLTWTVLLNCRLEPTSDLGQFMRYAMRQVFVGAGRRRGGGVNPLPVQVPTTTSPLPVLLTSSSPAILGSSSSQWIQQQADSGAAARRPNEVGSNEIGDVDDDMAVVTSAASRLVDAMSRDGRTCVKLMVADYRVEQLVTSLATYNYRPTWIDACTYRGHVFFNVIWTRNDDAIRWRVYFDLSAQRYRKRFRARVVRGYRLTHVETYIGRHRRLRYAAIFVRAPGGGSKGSKSPSSLSSADWTAYEGVTAQRHRSEFYRHLRDVYRLSVQSVTEYQGQLYVAAIYDKAHQHQQLGDGRVRLGLTTGDFAAELERQLNAGRVLSYADAYEQRGSVRFSAVWSPLGVSTRPWAASHSLSKYTLLNKLVDYAAINVPIVCVAAYVDDDDGGLYFAALWR
jgi:CubicO group peptidase (beta-lactamase class C family)